mmetsp:Transcript_70826/g.133866  ORF Transcript_70826/g.133866 Transcript_70826/m.133866 type:complete len:229 (+) Transcript_70826:1425-2111(+)
MTRSSALSLPRPSRSSSQRMCSHSSLLSALMSTSGINIGTKPFAKTRLLNSKCCFTISLIPTLFACLMTERILVPKTPARLASESQRSSCGMSLMSCTPCDVARKPVLIFTKGTMFFCSQTYFATGSPSILCFSDSWAKVTAMTTEPLNFGFVRIRARIFSEAFRTASGFVSSSTFSPYRCKTLIKSLPVLSRGAKMPSVLVTLMSCISFVGTATEALKSVTAASSSF